MSETVDTLEKELTALQERREALREKLSGAEEQAKGAQAALAGRLRQVEEEVQSRKAVQKRYPFQDANDVRW